MSNFFAPKLLIATTGAFWQLVSFRVLVMLTLALLSAAAWLLHYPVTSWYWLTQVLLLLLATNLALPLLPKHWRHTQAVLALGCALDFLAIFSLLWLSGGVSNGFIALLLLPVAVTAVLLSAWVSYLFALAAISSYGILLWQGDLTVLLQFDTGLGDHGLHQHLMQPFSQHMWQMWGAFIIAALLLCWFISRQTRLIRQQSQQLNVLQQHQLRQEQALAIATYAANAAHDLASPIQNLLLLTDEIAPELQQHPVLPEIQQQLTRCQQIIAQLRQHAGDWRDLQVAELYPVLLQSLQSWSVTRPELDIRLTEHSDQSHCRIPEATAVASAVFQILDNAALASIRNQQPKLQLELQLNQQQLSLRIVDCGEGLSEQRLAELGHVPQHSEQGLGWGQFLANISIERLGGRVQRRNLPQGGLETLISFKDQY
ncbi:ATP-binding protein [Rheinheimera sp. 4Y26]|uniref:ATP-binding protein n=1 Tax=Rheinheimera sp. 4Y26 TaxID=2977811 RepID=UPI0021B0FA9E|nr:ATP-binding protein [Rheinheimera sp. 4Y26]MCT6698361.1 ATP-binding protein [Rheinheimera sp. 4Y26]